MQFADEKDHSAEQKARHSQRPWSMQAVGFPRATSGSGGSRPVPAPDLPTSAGRTGAAKRRSAESVGASTARGTTSTAAALGSVANGNGATGNATIGSSASGTAPTGTAAPQSLEGPGAPASSRSAPSGIASSPGKRAASLPASGQPAIDRRRTPSAASTSLNAAPLPKRPKGRWFISTCLVLLFGTLTYSLWNALWRYQAHGVVSAKVTQLSLPAAGRVMSVAVREGDLVAAGDLLAEVEYPELEQQLARTHEELRVALATCSAEIVRLRWQDETRVDRKRDLLADYFRFVTQLNDTRALLDQRTAVQKRLVSLVQRKAASVEELEQAEKQIEGLEENVRELTRALDELRQQSAVELGNDEVAAQIEPYWAKVALLHGELDRLQKVNATRELRAPTPARIVRRHRHAGELADKGEPIMELAELGTEHFALYVPQAQAAKLLLDDQVSLSLAGTGQRVKARVWRIDPQVSSAPVGLERYYLSREQLVVVRMLPEVGQASEFWDPLVLGTQVRWPRPWWPQLARETTTTPTAASLP